MEIGVVINDGEKGLLMELAFKHNIFIPYIESFKNDYNYHMFIIINNTITITGTQVMRSLKTIIHGINNLDKFLSK